MSGLTLSSMKFFTGVYRAWTETVRCFAVNVGALRDSTRWWKDFIRIPKGLQVYMYI